MAKEKNAQEIGELLSGQIDGLSTGKATSESLKAAYTVANLVGKIQSQAKLEVSFAKATGRDIPDLPSMMRPDTPKRKK